MEDKGDDGAAGHAGFFACYLLCSLNPRTKGRTYIGFTVNPIRRLRQHNGELVAGAWRTKQMRPSEMVLCLHSFPTKRHALQFEWAWQHPFKSKAVREMLVGEKKWRFDGVKGKVKLMYMMLTLSSWSSRPLTVQFLTTKHLHHRTGCLTPPPSIRTVVGPLNILEENIQHGLRHTGDEDDEGGVGSLSGAVAGAEGGCTDSCDSEDDIQGRGGDGGAEDSSGGFHDRGGGLELSSGSDRLTGIQGYNRRESGCGVGGSSEFAGRVGLAGHDAHAEGYQDSGCYRVAVGGSSGISAPGDCGDVVDCGVAGGGCRGGVGRPDGTSGGKGLRQGECKGGGDNVSSGGRHLKSQRRGCRDSPLCSSGHDACYDSGSEGTAESCQGGSGVWRSLASGTMTDLEEGFVEEDLHTGAGNEVSVVEVPVVEVPSTSVGFFGSDAWPLDETQPAEDRARGVQESQMGCEANAAGWGSGMEHGVGERDPGEPEACQGEPEAGRGETRVQKPEDTAGWHGEDGQEQFARERRPGNAQGTGSSGMTRGELSSGARRGRVSREGGIGDRPGEQAIGTQLRGTKTVRPKSVQSPAVSMSKRTKTVRPEPAGVECRETYLAVDLKTAVASADSSPRNYSQDSLQLGFLTLSPNSSSFPEHVATSTWHEHAVAGSALGRQPTGGRRITADGNRSERRPLRTSATGALCCSVDDAREVIDVDSGSESSAGEDSSHKTTDWFDLNDMNGRRTTSLRVSKGAWPLARGQADGWGLYRTRLGVGTGLPWPSSQAIGVSGQPVAAAVVRKKKSGLRRSPKAAAGLHDAGMTVEVSSRQLGDAQPSQCCDESAHDLTWCMSAGDPVPDRPTTADPFLDRSTSDLVHDKSETEPLLDTSWGDPESTADPLPDKPIHDPPGSRMFSLNGAVQQLRAPLMADDFIVHEEAVICISSTSPPCHPRADSSVAAGAVRSRSLAWNEALCDSHDASETALESTASEELPLDHSAAPRMSADSMAEELTTIHMSEDRHLAVVAHHTSLAGAGLAPAYLCLSVHAGVALRSQDRLMPASPPSHGGAFWAGFGAGAIPRERSGSGRASGAQRGKALVGCMDDVIYISP